MYKKLRKTILAIAPAIIIAINTGCSTPIGLGYTVGDTAAPVAGAAGGAIGYMATSGQDQDTRMMAAGAGALGGYMLAEMLKNRAERDRQKEFRDGFYLGASNIVKAQYWELQELQKGNPDNVSVVRRKYVFPGVDEKDGINYMPHSVQTTVGEMK